MTANAFLASYSAKVLEYTLAITYLILFVGFWRYVQGGKVRPGRPPLAFCFDAEAIATTGSRRR